jgi:hypothetical protein
MFVAALGQLKNLPPLPPHIHIKSFLIFPLLDVIIMI